MALDTDESNLGYAGEIIILDLGVKEIAAVIET